MYWRLYGYNGICTHTVDDVKRWCEEYLVSLYIIDYDEELKKLIERSKMSTSNYEGKDK